jgi:MarR family 2-MHQ and catechol resistance regulon transcriptional repressor
VDIASRRKPTTLPQQQYRMIHNVYVLLDDGDRRVLSPFGLSLPQYRVLKALDLEKGQRLTTLSERLLRAKSTITRIVDQLEQDGLVRRLSDVEDRRAQRVVLTPTGADLCNRASAAHEQALARRLNLALDSEEQSQFHILLTKLRNSLVESLPHLDNGGGQPARPGEDENGSG